jgi:LAGLIDADG endonuclease
MDKFNILDNGNISVSHFKNRDDILIFLEKNPMWLSGFVCGEGCFTGYLSLDIKSLWGLQPGLDFNIMQSTNDKILLEAINLYFGNKGGVYSKPNKVSVVAFINVKVLKEVIVPFFYKYPLVGIKSYELERWIKLIDIYYNKKHIGIDISTKNYILEFAKICKELNIRRVNKNKLDRINIIIDWLKNLDSFPSKDEKFNLIKLIKTRSIQI